MKVTLVLPTLNEIEAIKEILPRIKKKWCDQIIVVDGKSTDGTIEYVKNKGYLIHIQKGKGLRRAYQEILDLIEGDIFITFTPDGNSIPELIPELIKKMEEGYDMVIVSRYLDGAKSYDDDPITSFGNWMFTKLINLFYSSSYTDTLVGFRAYKKDVIRKLDLDKDSSFWIEKLLFMRMGIGWEPLSSIRCAKKKFKVTEIPGDEPKRIGGKRKLQLFRGGLAILLLIFIEIFSWRKSSV